MALKSVYNSILVEPFDFLNRQPCFLNTAGAISHNPHSDRRPGKVGLQTH
jgi:hypothetical protein